MPSLWLGWTSIVLEPLDLLIVEERMRERVADGMELPPGVDAQEAALWALLLAEWVRRSRYQASAV